MKSLRTYTLGCSEVKKNMYNRLRMEETKGVVSEKRREKKQFEAGGHHYTTSGEEKDNLVGLGWKYEGIGWYGVAR